MSNRYAIIHVTAIMHLNFDFKVSSNQAFLARAKQNKRVSTRVTGKMSGLSPLLSMNLSMKGKSQKVSLLVKGQ